MSELSDTNEKRGQTSVGRKVTAVTNPGDCAMLPFEFIPSSIWYSLGNHCVPEAVLDSDSRRGCDPKEFAI